MITRSGLRTAYPEWTDAPDDVVDNVVAVANALVLDLYTDSTEEDDRRYLEASAVLYDLPFGRAVRKVEIGQNPYRAEALRRDHLKGTAYRAPGWTLPAGVV